MSIIDRVLTDEVNYIAMAVPFFFLLIGIELFVSWLGRKDYYRFDDSLNDLACGIVDQVVGLLIKGALFVGYLYLFDRFRMMEMAEYSARAKWVAAFALFLGVDCCYYWFHRIAHEMNAPWAAHIVHHQSEQYNLSVALRQGTLQGAFSWIFYLPLAIIGFPPAWFVAMASFDTLYQFWIHTRIIGRLGPLEWFLNTPSHHRVHHARNPKYIDKNYAGTLIIWDKMFGTFAAEDEEPVYGIVRPLNSWNPLWANFHRWVAMAKEAYAAPRFVDKLKIWFMPPAWKPAGLPPNLPTPEVSRERVIVYSTPIPFGLGLYILAHFVLTLMLGVYLLNSDGKISLVDMLAPAGVVLWSLVNVGGLFEGRRWILWSEPLRLAVGVAGTVSAAYSSSMLWTAPILAVCSFGWLMLYRGRFVHPGGGYVAESRILDQAPAEPAAVAGAGLEPVGQVGTAEPAAATAG